MWEIAEPSGPIENGTTYIVRPAIEPRKSSVSVSRISSGSRQLLVGPASASFSEQMKVRSSTRATSPGSERAMYEWGRLAAASLSKVPASTSCWQSWSYSSAEPSHQWIDSGCVRVAISSTHAISFAFLVGTFVSTAIPGLLPWHKHRALELSDKRAVLLVDTRVDFYYPAVRLGTRRRHLEALGLGEQRVAVEDRGRVAELVRCEVRDRLARHIRNRHSERQRVHQRADHNVLALLALRRVDVVQVQRVMVHRDEAEEVVIRLRNGLRGPVLVDGAYVEFLQVAPVCVGTGGFAGSLIRFEGVVGHRFLRREEWSFVDSRVNEAGDVNCPAV